MTLGQYSSVLPLHLVTKRSIFKTADHIAFLWSYNPRLNTQAEFAVVNFISVSGLSNNARDTQYCFSTSCCRNYNSKADGTNFVNDQI